MPTPVIHLCVAKKIVEKYSVIDKAAFYLGSISPDAVYGEPTYYDVDGKDSDHQRAHLQKPDFADWKKNVTGFIHSMKSDVNRDFIIGYGVHILTDILWKETLFAEFLSQIPLNDTNATSPRVLYYKDMEITDYEMFKAYDLEADVWQCLSNNPIKTVENSLVNGDDMLKWKVNVLRLFAHKTHVCDCKALFFTSKALRVFIENAAASIPRALPFYFHMLC